MLAFLIAPAFASACDTTFDGSTDDTWEDASNWSNGVPTISNLACIPSPLAVTVASARSVGALTVDSGASLELKAGGTLTVGGGSLGVSSLVDGTLIFTGGTLVLAGAPTTVSHNVNGSGGGQLTVQSGSQLDLASGADVTGGGVIIDNLGLLTISGSTGANPTNVDAVLNNNGLIANDGPVNVIAGGGGDGTWKLGSGTGVDEPVVTIAITPFGMNGDFTDADSGGVGHLRITDSTLTMGSTATTSPHITVDRLDMTNANSTLDFVPFLVGDAAVRVNELNIENPAGLLEVDGYLRAQYVNMPAGNMLAGGDWELGQFHWGGGDITSANGSTVSVGALDMNFVTGDLGNRSLSGDVRLLMNGSLSSPTYSGGVGTSTFTLNNTSTFQIPYGVHFDFGDDLDILGTGTVANEGIIDKKGGGGTSLIQPQVATQNGELWVTDPSATLDLALAPDTFSGGVLTGTVIAFGTLRFPGAVTTFSGQSEFGVNGRIVDSVSGFDAMTTLAANGLNSTITIENPTALSQSFTNQGTVNVASGGTLTVAPGKTYTQQPGGTTWISHPSASLTVAGGVTMTGGTVKGVGAVNADVTNTGGTVAPGNSPGTLTINGNYTQGAGGTLVEEIEGADPTQYDRLLVTGTATLGGTLALQSSGGYVPPNAQGFDVIGAAGGVTGTFATITQLPDTTWFEPGYGANAVRLTASSVSIADATVGEEAGPATFTVTLGAPSASTVSVDWATQDGTATAGSDYTAGGGTVTFAPGETSKTVSVPVTGDSAVEGGENFAVNLSNPANTRVRDANGVGTIADDDSPPQAVAAQVAPGDIDGFAVAPPPVQGKAVNVAPVSGKVLVRLPGTTKFVPLPDAEQVPVGTIVDARAGRVRLFSVAARGRIQSAEFFEGVFQVFQKRGQALTEARLFGGSFAGCPRPGRASAAAKKKSVRHLWGSGSGQFRTKGRYASATIRGTRWLTDDRCDGTLVRVTQGAVTVRDLTRKRSLVLKKPRSYLAPARS